ncbi:MAG: Ig-like domain-containing protein [bacterium]|nr:Ig-like domain-containing protein [bacterium]
MKLIKSPFYWVIFILLGCAQQVPPNGGLKDEIPPKIIGSRPANKSIHFESDKIVIKFNEYIQIKDQNQIIISPLLEDKPTIEANGKSIEITFGKNKPIKNTTYTINFGNSIVDVNEGNVLSNTSYVFSTGDVLDSNRISGNIKEAYTQKNQKDIVIGLYQVTNFNDSILSKKYPNYFGKTNDSGVFVIENLPTDSFYLIAFSDQNLDNKYQKNEDVAFVINPIYTALTDINIKLNIFKPNPHLDNTIIDSLSRQKGKYQFAVYRPNDIQIKPIGKATYYTNISKGKAEIDTINIYIPSYVDSTQAILTINKIDTNYTVMVHTKSKSKLTPFYIQIENPEKPGDSIFIRSNTPIDTILTSQIMFMEDTLRIKNIYLKQTDHFNWVLYYPFKENVAYQIILNDSAIINSFKQANTKINNTFIGKSSKDFGNVILNISSIKKKGYLLQLVEQNSEEKIVAQYNSPFADILTIWNLKAGNYQLKLVQDKNQNGIWDNGNFKKRIQPEAIYYDNQTITVKAYWDIEQSVNIEKIINN